MYLHKKITFAEMRAETIELWSKGERVTCGVITGDTRVTFRSQTAQVITDNHDTRVTFRSQTAQVITDNHDNRVTFRSQTAQVITDNHDV